MTKTELIHEKAGAPDVNDDLSNGFSIGDELKDTSVSPEVLYECLDNANGAAIWANKSEALGLKKNISMTFGANNGFAQVNSATYTYKGSWPFAGSDKVPGLSKISVNAWANNGAATMDVRVFDVTNAQVICESTGIGSTQSTITDLGALSNIPTGEALFTIQIRRASGAGQVRIASLTIEY